MLQVRGGRQKVPQLVPIQPTPKNDSIHINFTNKKRLDRQDRDEPSYGRFFETPVACFGRRARSGRCLKVSHSQDSYR